MLRCRSVRGRVPLAYGSRLGPIAEVRRSAAPRGWDLYWPSAACRGWPIKVYFAPKGWPLDVRHAHQTPEVGISWTAPACSASRPAGWKKATLMPRWMAIGGIKAVEKCVGNQPNYQFVAV